MDDVAENSSSSAKNDKPVIVRVKRKAHQLPLQAFWVEICERPLKRPFLDFQKLSIHDSFVKVEEIKTKKVFVRHVETVSSTEFSIDALQPYIHSELVDGIESKLKTNARRNNLKTENKQHKLLVKAREKQMALSKNARLEQIWSSRKQKKEVHNDDGLREACHFYDVVRVDVEDTCKELQQQKDELEDHRIIASYLPLLREFIPSAAVEVESDIHDYESKRASEDGYVYDLYTVKDDIHVNGEEASNPFPLVQVNDEDYEYYDGPSSEYESDDSNAEDNPLNEYPDEDISEDDDVDDSGSRTTKDESSEEVDSENGSVDSSSGSEDRRGYRNWSQHMDPLYDGDFHCDNDSYDDHDGSAYGDYDAPCDDD